jgi:lysyl-tRNA synthetase class II
MINLELMLAGVVVMGLIVAVYEIVRQIRNDRSYDASNEELALIRVRSNDPKFKIRSNDDNN